jgi:AcrR family transcriptional regulator
MTPTQTRHTATYPTAPAHPRMSAEERREQVVEAAVRAFASGGLAGTSTEDVARLAGVSQPYLFRLFGSKHELFVAAVGRAFERIRIAFEEAARHPEPGLPPDQGVLHSMGRAYGDLLADRSLLRMQLHAFAACDDPDLRSFVRQEFAALVARVAALANVPPDALRAFFAEGMLLNVAAAMDLTESDVAWRRICDGGLA